MMCLEYTVVAPEMVWLTYKENNDKHVKELLGKDAVQFLKFIKTLEHNGNAVLSSWEPLASILPKNATLQVKSGESRIEL